MKTRVIALLLALVLVLGLAACTSADQPENTPEPTGEVTPTPAAQPDQINFAVLSGPTGVGAAKLLTDNEAGKAAFKYNVTVASDNSEIAAKLLNGDLDIACMASNVAANLYNKSSGKVQALCLSTLGVLYILERGEGGITSMAELKGKTIYATGQGANPEFVLNHLLKENGLDPKQDVDIVWKTPQEVQAAMLTGEAEFAMLPVPAATAVQVQAKAKGIPVSAVLDLTEEWNKVSSDSVLTMTTVVVRTEFAQQYPQAVEQFLREYAASIDYVNNNVDQAAEMVVQFGIVPAVPIAKLAIPDCNLVYVDGAAMQKQIEGYYKVLFEADPASVGGAVPDNGFYYGAS